MTELNIRELHNFYCSKMFVRWRQRRTYGMHGRNEKHQDTNILVE